MQYLLEMEFTNIMPQDYTGSAALGGFTKGASTHFQRAGTFGKTA